MIQAARALLTTAVTACLLSSQVHAEADSVQLVVDGEPAAVIVTANDPGPMAKYAAEELVEHVKLATGAELPVTGESDIPEGYESRIFLGLTEQTLDRGFYSDPKQERQVMGRRGMQTYRGELGPDVFVLHSDGPDLFIFGDEDAESDPLATTTENKSGTLFGVYELLERYVGVRWLWPGELGREVPETDTLVIDQALNETVEPKLKWRRIRWQPSRYEPDGHLPEYERLGFSTEVLKQYADDLVVFLRRHRQGYSEGKVRVGHEFTDWWPRYGQDHPEWFALQPEGYRGSDDPEALHVNMCVANPDLHDYLLQRYENSFILLGESDARNYCVCEDCRAWNGPEAEEVPWFAEHNFSPRVSYRYARFWEAIAERARARDPDALVTTFLYHNYFAAPAPGSVDLNNVFGEFVPWAQGGRSHISFFPMKEEPYEWVKQQWLKWSEAGVKMAYRPNYTLGGYTMPYVSIEQTGDFFRFAYEHGMIGTDYDSLNGQWAAQGPEIYLRFRQHVRPEADIQDILDEYYDSFGPAAPYVRGYFEYWEHYVQSLVNAGYDGRYHRLRPFRQAHMMFPPKSFRPARQMLSQAWQAARAASNDRYRERVEFLKLGLEHAALCAELSAHFEGLEQPPDDPDRFVEAQRAILELINFRKAHEEAYFADFARYRSRERQWWNTDALFEDE